MPNVSNPTRHFFHVGCPKTGTTTLQQVWRDDPRVELIKFGRTFNTDRWYRIPHRPADGGDGSVVVHSDENMVSGLAPFAGFFTTIRRIRRVHPDAHVYLTIREQRSFLVSSYRHQVIHTAEAWPTLEHFLDSHRGRAHVAMAEYASIADELIAHFGPDRVHVLPMELMRDDFDAYFRRLYAPMDLEPPPGLEPFAANRGPDDTYVRLKASLNRALPDRHPRLLREVNRAGRFLYQRARDAAAPDRTGRRRLGWGDGPLCRDLEELFRAQNRELERIVDLPLARYGYLL
jgi:hypothetical protein